MHTAGFKNNRKPGIKIPWKPDECDAVARHLAVTSGWEEYLKRMNVNAARKKNPV